MMKRFPLFCVLSSLLLLPFSAPSVSAKEFRIGDLEGSFDTTISLGGMWRVEKRDPALIGRYNPKGSGYSSSGEKGNLNYGLGIISEAVKVTHDLQAHYDNYDMFIRASYFYDNYNMTKRQLSKDAKDRVGKDFTLLDAFLSGHYYPGGKSLNIRVGNQVLNWGESTFIRNGINAINPLDVAKLRVPGAELREGFKPMPLLSASLQLTDSLSIEGFYLFRSDVTDPDPAGSYFSDNDFAVWGGYNIITGYGAVGDCASFACVPRINDVRARSNGQYGFALRYYSEALNDTEFGLYFMNYHSRLPVVNAVAATSIGVPPTAAFFNEYTEDIKLYGISFNTNLGDNNLALQGEFSYRTNVPLQIDASEILVSALRFGVVPGFPQSQLGLPQAGEVVKGYRKHRVAQWQFTLTQAFGPQPVIGADQFVLAGEVGGSYVNLPDKNTLRYAGGSVLPGNPFMAAALGVPVGASRGFADRNAWGYTILGSLDYFNVFRGVNLSPHIAFSHDVNGTSPGPGGTFLEGRMALNLGITGTYLNSWSSGLNYTSYFGGAIYNTLRDRDFISFDIKYSF